MPHLFTRSSRCTFICLRGSDSGIKKGRLDELHYLNCSELAAALADDLSLLLGSTTVANSEG